MKIFQTVIYFVSSINITSSSRSCILSILDPLPNNFLLIKYILQHGFNLLLHLPIDPDPISLENLHGFRINGVHSRITDGLNSHIVLWDVLSLKFILHVKVGHVSVHIHHEFSVTCDPVFVRNAIGVREWDEGHITSAKGEKSNLFLLLENSCHGVGVD